jgi:hypothetical protein
LAAWSRQRVQGLPAEDAGGESRQQPREHLRDLDSKGTYGLHTQD